MLLLLPAEKIMNIKLALSVAVGILIAAAILAGVVFLVHITRRLRLAAQERETDLPAEAVILRLSPEKLVRVCGQPVSTNPPHGGSDWTEVTYGNYIFSFDRGRFMAVERVLPYPEGFRGAKWYADVINDLPCLQIKPAEFAFATDQKPK